MDSNPEIRELEDTITHYKASEGQHVDMLRRIQEILDETDDDSEVI